MSVKIISKTALEPWDWRAPWDSGVGGSEVSAIEMAERLPSLISHPVESYTMLPSDTVPGTIHSGAAWYHCNDFTVNPGDVIINYRTPQLFEAEKVPGSVLWFIAQDVSYEFRQEDLAKIDRYVCLCQEHARHTSKLYPQLFGKIFVSSNGVRSELLDANWSNVQHSVRKPHRMLYASSPDRGLKLLLENWFRIRERCPDAELRVAYGFNNMEVIAKMSGGSSWHVGYQQELEALLQQDGVTWLGRLPQDKLYDEWFQAAVWPYPSGWPETSGITALDAMACGAQPITNRHWAVGENVQWGVLLDGIPQHSELVRSLWLDALYDALDHPMPQDKRDEMMAWARKNFAWDRFAKQFAEWLEADLKGD